LGLVFVSTSFDWQKRLSVPNNARVAKRNIRFIHFIYSKLLKQSRNQL
jgi:hypothetical protein